MNHTDKTSITSVGPGTLMGRLMRQYWIPALKSDELPGIDCNPVRVMLLGEKLVGFRDTAGRVGLLSEACPHRGASLYFGRNEDHGLRCAYHGWKFNVAGECQGMPCEPRDSKLWQRVRTTAYPCIERGGIVWTYMGPRESLPPLPEFGINTESSGGRVDLAYIDCNWLQNLEGDVDMDHLPVLHGGNFESFKATLRGDAGRAASGPDGVAGLPAERSLERMPMEVIQTSVGCAFACNVSGGLRSSASASPHPIPELWTVGQFMLPFYAMLPYGSLGSHWIVARVPMDDHHTMTFGLHASSSAVPSEDLMFGPEPTRVPDSADWFGRARLARNSSNDFGLNRELAKNTRGAFAVGAGIQGQGVQDACIVRSMGAVVDRTQEHLTPGDAMIVAVRKRLLTGALALEQHGTAPDGVDDPWVYRMQQGMLRARKGRSWRVELEEHTRRTNGSPRDVLTRDVLTEA